MLVGLIFNRTAGGGIRKQKGHKAWLHLILFYSFLFSILILFILDNTACQPITYAKSDKCTKQKKKIKIIF